MSGTMPKREPISVEYDKLLEENDALRLEIVRRNSSCAITFMI